MTEKNTTTKRVRPQRTSINGVRNRINIRGKDPAYVYRLVNDINQGDRVQGFIENGWEIVQSKEIKGLGDKRVADPSAEGSTASMGVGGGTRAVLMKFPKEWYDEDQAVKEAQIQSQEAAMREETSREYEKGKFEKEDFVSRQK